MLIGAIGCGTLGGKRKSGSNTNSTSSSQPTSYDNLNTPSPDDNSEKSKESEKDSNNKDKEKSEVDEALPSKKELYDSIQISLGSSDDSVVEKSVANLLSQDQNDSRALNSLALYHLSKERDHLAKMIFKTMIEKDPQNPVVHNNLGALYTKIGEQRLAIESFRKAVSLNPNYALANANLGTIFAVGRDYSKARHFLEVAYRGGIKDLAVLNNYAVALMENGDSEADSIFKEALQIGVTDSNVSFNYALYLTYIKKNYKEASDLIDKLRFMGVAPQKKSALLRMEETISGKENEQSKGQ